MTDWFEWKGMIEITEKAKLKIAELRQGQDNPDLRLRLFVKEGGCSGYEYGMKLDSYSEGDLKLGEPGQELFIDPDSYTRIEGSMIDFDDGLHGTGFSVKNPKAKETCGCGKSFQ